ncbi:proteoglycan 4 [Hetaerina americana]|uniref:proteoglycan 4 n=1 Tax=Hetaerina americana TaxID=62018 RepID=UPI003A7F5A3E
MALAKGEKKGPSPVFAMGTKSMALVVVAFAVIVCISSVSANTQRLRNHLPIPLERNALKNKYVSENSPTETRERRSPRGLFSPRLEYDEWTPLGRGDPLKNDPTYDYVPPVLERVHYWMDPSSRTPDVPQPTLASALPPTPPSATTPSSAADLRPQNVVPPAVPVHPTTVIVYPSNVKHPISTSATPGGGGDPFSDHHAVADARLDAHPFLTFVDGPKFTPKQPPVPPPTLPPHRRVTHYGEFRPLSTQQPQKHHSHGPQPPRHSAHPYRMSPPYYTPTRHTHLHAPHLQLQIGQLEEGEFDISTAPGQLPTPLQMLVPPPLPGNESPVPFVQHNLLLQEQTRTTSGQTLTPPEMQKPSPATVPDPNTTPVYPVFTAPTTHPPRETIPTHPPTTPPPTEATTSQTTEDPEKLPLSTLEVKEPEQYMVPPPNDPLSPIPDFSGATVEIQESLDLSTSTLPSSTGLDKWTGTQSDQPSTPHFTQTSQSAQTTTLQTAHATTTTPILYVTFPPTTTQAPTTTTPPTPPTSTTPSLTTDPLFSHYKQPSAPLRGPMYLIIEGHSKVKTYGAGKNSIHGIPIVGSGEKEAVDDRSKGGPRRRVGAGRSLWEEDPASIGILPPPETDPSENDVLREEWVAASRKKHGVFVVPPWGTPRRHEGGEMPIGPRAIQPKDDDSED